MNEHYDIIISGSGLVATSLIAALRNTGLRIAVLETYLPTSFSSLETRPLSLAYGSQKILQTLGIWPTLAPQAALIQTVQVSEESRFGALHFRAIEEQVPALGYVVSFDELQNHLYQCAVQSQSVKLIAIQKLISIEMLTDKVSVSVATINGRKTLETGLFVAADGTHSPARKLLGIVAAEKTSDDVALTVTVEVTQPHQNCAYERFTTQGIIAVLPLKNPQKCRMVWALPRAFADTVSSWSDLQLASYLRCAMRERLGELRIVDRSQPFALQAVLAQQQIRPGVVLLGNAAHTLYPVAAQGFNLGLRDVAVLAELLVDACDKQQALGSESLLKSYLGWRSADQRWITGITGGVGQLFDLRIPGLGLMRGAGLLATDLISPLKHRLAKRLMGLAGKCPKLVRGIAL